MISCLYYYFQKYAGIYIFNDFSLNIFKNYTIHIYIIWHAYCVRIENIFLLEINEWDLNLINNKINKLISFRTKFSNNWFLFRWVCNQDAKVVILFVIVYKVSSYILDVKIKVVIIKRAGPDIFSNYQNRQSYL